MKKTRRDFLKLTANASIGLASISFIRANKLNSHKDKMEYGRPNMDRAPAFPGHEKHSRGQYSRERKIFVESGRPLAIMGAATKDISRVAEGVKIPPDHSWGNPLFADAALLEEDFHIHARLTLGELAGTGASFIIGGHYHFPCSRPEGNRSFRVSLDDDLEIYRREEIDTDVHVVHGITEPRALWSHAKKEVAGKSREFIKPGKPFNLDMFQSGRDFAFLIDGREVFMTSLRDKITGSGDGGWPVCFGFLPGRGKIKLHEFHAEGNFPEISPGSNDVWMMGYDGYFTYRIPTICYTPGGSLLAFAEARRVNLNRGGWDWMNRRLDEVHCVMKKSHDLGKTWTGQKMILEQGHVYEARNASPVVDWETGEVFLVLIGQYIMSSKNDGESWSEVSSLGGVLGNNMDYLIPGPGPGIQLREGPWKGRLVVPVDARNRNSPGSLGCGVLYSDDHGKNWKLGRMTVLGDGINEPQVVELGDGQILMNARHRIDKPGRLISASNDGGISFESYFLDEQLPSKGCNVSLAWYSRPGGKEGEVIFCGRAEGRRKLTVKLSRDNCETWPVAREIYSGSSAYSTMAVLPDGQAGVLFEKDGYRRLSFVKFSLDWIAGTGRY